MNFEEEIKERISLVQKKLEKNAVMLKHHKDVGTQLATDRLRLEGELRGLRSLLQEKDSASEKKEIAE